MAKKKKASKSKPKKKAVKKATKKATKKTSKKAAPKKASKKKVSAKKSAKKAVKKAATKPAQKTAKKASASKGAPKKSSPAKTRAAALGTETLTGPHPLIGASIPDFTLPNQNGEHVNLSELVSSTPKVVLYFYPKDDTPGCTAEACGFRDNLNRVEGKGIKVVGVSPDSPESHQRFREKYGLNFDLLSDTDHQLADALKVWKEKNFMGKNYMGVERSTFLIKDGQIASAWQPVKVEGHVDEVLNKIEEI